MNLADIIFLEDLVIFVFRMVNFVVMLGLLGYGFKLYGLPSLSQAYQTYYNYFDYLNRRHEHLMHESNAIDQAKHTDLQEQEYLKERLMCWARAVEDKHVQIRNQADKQRLNLLDRLKMQQERIREYRFKEQVMPLAIADARKRLIKDARTHEFQHSVIQKTKTLLRKALE